MQILHANMDALVQPITGKAKQNRVAPCGVLAVNPSDLACFAELARDYGLKKRFLFNAQLYNGPDFFIAGPAVGAPMAALCLETLITLGARRVLLYSWCGSLRKPLRVGNLFLPLSAVSEEGTSRHYPYEDAARDIGLETALHDWLLGDKLTVFQGLLWSTDAPFRETPEKIAAYRREGVLAVDMEYAALRAVAAFRGIQFAALFTVSDELFHEQWRPAFTGKDFRRTSQRNLKHLCTFLENSSDGKNSAPGQSGLSEESGRFRSDAGSP